MEWLKERNPRPARHHQAVQRAADRPRVQRRWLKVPFKMIGDVLSPATGPVDKNGLIVNTSDGRLAVEHSMMNPQRLIETTGYRNARYRLGAALATIFMMTNLPNANGAEEAVNQLGLVPVPAEIAIRPGTFVLNQATPIVVEGDDRAVRAVAELLARDIATQTGFSPQVMSPRASADAGGIMLAVGDTDESLGAEGYDLDVATEGITIRARTAAGLFRGTQTLRQLLSWRSGKDRSAPVDVPVNGVSIHDMPQYSWRGMHLDVCRHFMPVSFVKRYIDLLALHKYNVFHWHLTEDQGWRIEIKRYPKLTEVGAWRDEDGQRYGGFYTQDEVRDVVAYAAERHIIVVPEIEMPGHSLAALAAYPELSCTGGPFKVATSWGIFEDVYCAGNEQTFEFLQNVLDEVLELFPSEYIHIGGDECPKTRWKACAKCQTRIKAERLGDEDELQSYFVQRMSQYLVRKGRRLVGWDEILEGGLAPGAIVMSWRGTEGGIKAARAGHDVIMSPTSHCYFDYRQADSADEPGATYAGPLTLRKVYEFDPTPDELSTERAKHVLGGQANVWTEQIVDERAVEYMVFPRMCALAETMWSPPAVRDWSHFRGRLEKHIERLDAMGVNYRPLDP